MTCDDFLPRGVIFILLRKMLMPIILIVAWTGVSLGAYFKFSYNEKARIEYVTELAMKIEEEVAQIEAEEEAAKKAEEELERKEIEKALANKNRGNATSRGGSRTDRASSNVVYYEDLGLNVADYEIEMLERIVQAEAGGSGYDGMLAVANVVLNRVKYERFPNTVEEVIFAQKQFTPISDGRYYTVKVSDTAKQVVEDALNGARILDEDALYFCTPTAPGKGWFETSLRKITYIAPHNFYGYY